MSGLNPGCKDAPLKRKHKKLEQDTENEGLRLDQVHAWKHVIYLSC